MQTVEQNYHTIADDGQSLPKERGSTGEQTHKGSVAESQAATQREWEELIASERYGALYRAHVSEIIQKRLGQEKQSSALLQQAAEMLEIKDPTQLPARIAQLLAPAERDWTQEVGAVQDKYPEFDLQEQSKNPAFAALLQGFAKVPEVSLTTLYELYELDNLKKAAAQSAAADTARQIMGAVQIRHARPHENGLRDMTSETGRASRLTRAQRAVLAERAAKGEHITF
ncbi:MAG: hypothetical protein IIW17_00390 [Clostridia bacterium]|nr:hypothetical protein [Clostridia bacterium]MBQ2255958.1 hypothetical protein [Clostridia bacterium]MBQ5362967.1 hypothetical protein [Clostridia bacterium]MBQ5792457.1 hypothetical protein [Clostridia bacterium]